MYAVGVEHPLKEPSREDIVAALSLHLAHAALQTRDVMHLATMTQNRISTIVTADRHFDAIPGVRRVDPADWRVLRPQVASGEQEAEAE